jgi:ribonucleoside-diphosphate reductase alpha chain
MEKNSLNLSENAARVLRKRYLAKNEKGEVTETPKGMFRRVAKNIIEADKLYENSKNIKESEEKFYKTMTDLDFLPNSPTLMNAGRDLQQLSACFVLPIEDSMESIFETIKNTAIIHKSGGGTGFSFSRLRAKNSQVRSTGGIASGPISFLKVFDAATQAVKQGGRRRGANMGILRVDHPDILEFIACKENDKDITNFNISVAITEDFMKKLDADEDYNLIDPHTGKAAGKLSAREVFDLIVKMAWKNGEPGIIFIDKMNEFNPTPKAGSYESTNPCGEQILLAHESCNLGSINLSKMVDNGRINWDKLSLTVETAVHFLDNVIDMNKFPLEKIKEMTKANRKIGLGVMGFADMLIKLGIAYNSEAAVASADKVMSFILNEARKASVRLAEEKGLFPNFKDSVYDTPGGPKLRNATLTTIAPTGTLSIIGDCSSGIEPLFAIIYYKEVMDKDRLPEINEAFKEIAKKRGFWSERLLKKIAKAGTIQKFHEIPDDVKKLFVTSHDIAPEWHIKIQAAFQKYTDNAVSKTINFAHAATIDDVKKTYLLAHELGCKGVTVYRDRSRDAQVLNIETKENAKAQEKAPVLKIIPRPRPAVTYGTTTKIATGCGNLYVTINEDEDGLPFEVFMQMGKAGGCAMSQLEAIGRLLSLALRSGIEFNSVIEQLRGIRCPSPSWERGGRIFSCSDAIARVVERRLVKTKKNRVSKEKNLSLERTTGTGYKRKNIEGALSQDNNIKLMEKKTGNIVGVCPDCGGALWHVEGCMVCKACGYSKCG